MKAGKIKTKTGNFILRESIDYKNCVLSVQASYGHYCTPQVSVENINFYSTVEIAFISKKDGNLIYLSDVKNIELFNRYKELKQIDQGDTVLGYVPFDLVSDLQTFLNQD